MASTMLGGRVGTFTASRVAPRVQRVAFAAHISSRPQRGALQVVAAEPETKKKRTDPAVKRAALAVERRMRNRSRRSACATFIKKVIKTSEALMKAPPSGENAPEVVALEKLVSETYKQIDMAVTKGVYHINTASRKKARVAKYKRQVLIAAGAYTPTPEQPGFSFYQRMEAAKAKAAAAAAGSA